MADPKQSWSRPHIDFNGLIKAVHYLILVDTHRSKYLQVIPNSPATSFGAIKALGRLFTQRRFCDRILSDNGSQFPYALFRD